MYTVYLDERHKTGLVRLTGGNRGLLYTNERKVEVETSSGEEGAVPVKVPKWAYDVYEIEDARNPGLAKCTAIETEHPFGDEMKILRKTLAKVLRKLGDYNSADYEEFNRYNEFAEAIGTNVIKGSETAPEPTDEELLEKAKALKIAEIDKYNSSANVNAFTVDGNPMWLDFDMRSRLRNSIDAADAKGHTEMTKNYGGVDFTYTIPVWRVMFNTVEDYAGNCQNISEQHKAVVRAMTTVEEVEGFDHTAGYPPHPSF